MRKKAEITIWASMGQIRNTDAPVCLAANHQRNQEEMARQDFDPAIDDQDPDTPHIIFDDDDDGDDDDSANEYNWSAICTAARLGRVEALRYLTTRRILLCTTTHMICENLVVAAARAGSAASVAYLHDRMFDADSPCACSCTGAVGRAAWTAPTPDVILWMRLHGCAGGCERASDQDLALAITRGHTAMAQYILSEAFLAVDRDILDGAMDMAASQGHIDTLRAVLDADASLRIAPIVVGAARGGRLDVLSWICSDGNVSDGGDDSDGDDDAKTQCADANRDKPPADAVRAAALMAASNGQLAALVWIVDRYAYVVDATLMRAAVGCGSVDVVRTIDALSPAPFDWRRFVVCAIGSGSVDVVRFIVEEKGVVIDPFFIADADIVSDEMLCYLSTVCAPEEMQAAFDATLVDGRLCRTARAEQMHGHIPHLCVGLASATGFGPCACARCLSGRGPCLETAASTRPAKRRRTVRRRRSAGAPSTLAGALS